MMLSVMDLDKFSWTATILSESIDILFTCSELFQIIPTSLHPLVRDESLCNLMSEDPMSLNPGTIESSLESSKGHSQCFARTIISDP